MGTNALHCLLQCSAARSGNKRRQRRPFLRLMIKKTRSLIVAKPSLIALRARCGTRRSRIRRAGGCVTQGCCGAAAGGGASARRCRVAAACQATATVAAHAPLLVTPACEVSRGWQELNPCRPSKNDWARLPTNYAKGAVVHSTCLVRAPKASELTRADSESRAALSLPVPAWPARQCQAKLLKGFKGF